MHEELNDLANYLKGQFEGVEVIEDSFEVCSGEVCAEFGGCAHCKGLMVAREVNENGQRVGPTRLVLCTHWCHRTKQT